MYTDEQEQIRMSLHQFFGGIITSSNLEEPQMKRQSLIALVTEELCKFCKDDKEQIDVVVAKPILRATEFILKQRCNNIVDNLRSTSLDEHEIEGMTNELNSLIKSLGKYINTIK